MTVPKALLGWICLLCAGCGTSDDASAPGPDVGGSAGAGGITGNGGAPSGGAGTPSVADVFDASVAVPSKDCRTEQVAKSCVSIAGTWNGAPVDLECTTATSPNFNFGQAWSMACSTGTMSLGVDIPHGPSRSYDYEFLPHDAPVDASVQISQGNPNMPSPTDLHLYPGSSNFVSAEIAGTVTVDPATRLDTLRGTFTTTWGPVTGSRGDEVPATLNGTFFSVQFMHSCSTDADCASPHSCVTSTCF